MITHQAHVILKEKKTLFLKFFIKVCLIFNDTQDVFFNISTNFYFTSKLVNID